MKATKSTTHNNNAAKGKAGYSFAKPPVFGKGINPPKSHSPQNISMKVPRGK